MLTAVLSAFANESLTNSLRGYTQKESRFSNRSMVHSVRWISGIDQTAKMDFNSFSDKDDNLSKFHWIGSGRVFSFRWRAVSLVSALEWKTVGDIDASWPVLVTPPNSKRSFTRGWKHG